MNYKLRVLGENMNKMWKWIKKNWKVVVKIVIFLVTTIMGTLLVLKVRKAILGKVKKPLNFLADAKDNTIIHINNGEKFIPYKLPLNKEGKQMKAKDVEGAGFSKEKIIVVEGKHEKVDRRNVKPIDDNALSSLGLSK